MSSPEQPHASEALVDAEKSRDDRDGEGHGCNENARHGRVDPPLPDGDDAEWNDKFRHREASDDGL